MRESRIEAYLAKRVKAMGGECRKVAWPGRRGAPDRLVMLPGAVVIDGQVLPRTVWVELKASGRAAIFPSGEREEAQAREHDRMRKMGQRVAVIDSLQGVEELLA